jgi:Na+/phosphate symporter
MAVAIIILATLSIFCVGISMLVFMPVMHQLAYEQDVWNSTKTDPKALVTRDTIYNAALAMPIFLIGAILLWAYLSVSRQSSYET